MYTADVNRLELIESVPSLSSGRDKEQIWNNGDATALVYFSASIELSIVSYHQNVGMCRGDGDSISDRFLRSN